MIIVVLTVEVCHLRSCTLDGEVLGHRVQLAAGGAPLRHVGRSSTL